MRLHSSLVLAVAATVASLACGERPRPQGHLEVWDTLWVYRATAEDTALLMPAWIAPLRDGVVVGDGNEPRVTAFDADGRVRWIYAPRSGDGPGEMRLAADAVESEEGLWLLDWGNRLVLVSDEGEFVRQLRISPDLTAVVGQIEPGTGDEAVLLPGSVLARVSLSDGRVTSAPMPIPWTRTPPGDWSPVVRMSSGGSLLAVGMVFGPEVLILQGDSVRGSVFREDIPYRRLGERVEVGGGTVVMRARPGIIPFGAWQICIVGSELWVLTGGAFLNDRVGIEEERPNNQLLVYSLEGTLLGRRTLPIEAYGISVTEDRVYLISYPHDDVTPTLLALARR
jgi:hypothetical protein